MPTRRPKAGAVAFPARRRLCWNCFFEHPKYVLSRAALLSGGWGGDEAVEDGNVDNYIYFLRTQTQGGGNARRD